MRYSLSFVIVALIILPGCGKKDTASSDDQILAKGTFGYDVDFLAQHEDILVLKSADENAQILLCGAYQGRVMTSTAEGMNGKSYGWMNYDLIASGEVQEHINAFGGEDRIWLGPEGGQFSIFFRPGSQFIFDDWMTPAALDTEKFVLVSSTDNSATFSRTFSLQNYSGFNLDMKIDRKIQLSTASEIEKLLDLDLAENIRMVAYESRNNIENIGKDPWNKENGALSIWILGMFNPSPSTTVVIPYREGNEDELGPIVNDSYFGKVPSDRLIVDEGVIYFSADGKYRSKIGLSPRRVLPVAGSYDSDNNVLTLIHVDIPEGVTDYVNSMWEMQEEPFAGDVINSYNDGPVDGKAMGPFYELESSSPAAFLEPGESLLHIHRTIHFTGEKTSLNNIAVSVLGVSLGEIESAFKSN
jgi:hypothetical protein